MAQTVPPSEMWVIDDGSSDATHGILERLAKEGVVVVRHAENLGRGAARERAMKELSNELALCCDATNVLEPGFAEKAARWFDRDDVAAVHGKLRQQPGGGAPQRWRGRHLFREGEAGVVNERATHSTWGAMVRRTTVLQTGNYSAACRHSEDAELGARLNAAGFKTVGDPNLTLFSISQNTTAQVLERYWRWYAGVEEKATLGGYLRNIWYSIKVMAAADMRAGDYGSALISLTCPHYQFWKTAVRGVSKSGQRGVHGSSAA